MKKLLALALTLLLLFSLAGCAAKPAPAEPSAWGIALTAQNVTPTGLTLSIAQSGGDYTGSLEYGSDFALETLTDGQWSPVPYASDDDIAWTLVAYMVPLGETTALDVNWEAFYGALPAGTYRLAKPFTDFRAPGDFDTLLHYAEFTLH